MRKYSVVLIVMLMAVSVLAAIGCGGEGGNAKTFTAPNGNTYTPAQYRFEFNDLYDKYKAAGSEDEKIEITEEMEGLGVFVEYDATGQVSGVMESSADFLREMSDFELQMYFEAMEEAQ